MGRVGRIRSSIEGIFHPEQETIWKRNHKSETFFALVINNLIIQTHDLGFHIIGDFVNPIKLQWGRDKYIICEKALPRLLNHVFSGIIRWMKQNDLQKYFFYDSLIVMAVQLWLVRRPSTSKITPKILALTKGCDDEHLIKHRFQKGLFLSVYKSFWQKRWTRTCIQNPNPRSPQIWHIMTFFVYYGWTQHSRINFACRRQPFNSLENSHWKKLVVPWV